MRVLIVEDDRLMARSIELMLGSVGLEHETVATAQDGIDLATVHDYDAVLLDLTLPDRHGFDVLRHLRTAGVRTPIIVLTGDSELESKIEGLGLGADDYVTKPFERLELLARVYALVRRCKLQGAPVVVTGRMSVDFAARAVEVGGHRLRLTTKEYEILEMLSLRKGSLLTKEMLLDHLYGGRDEPGLNIMDVFICRLRKKLARAGTDGTGYIETMWGRGYALRDPEGSKT